jgi:hypothetical protein
LAQSHDTNLSRHETLFDNCAIARKPGGAIAAVNTPRRRQEAAMNHSIHSADRATHLKIVVVALVAGIAVAGFSLAAHRDSSDTAQATRVIKAGAPTAFTSSDRATVR